MNSGGLMTGRSPWNVPVQNAIAIVFEESKREPLNANQQKDKPDL